MDIDLGYGDSAKSMADKLKGKEISMELAEWHEKRSLNANAYFHVLVDKIARATGAGNEETKRNIVLEYGAIGREENGMVSAGVLPKGVDPLKHWKYPRWYTDVEVNGKPWSGYLIYKETHTMDTSEMARLIDGAVSEAKELGIETIPPAELERMVSAWASIG